MVIIISEQDFLDKKKKFAKERDFFIIDATDKSGASKLARSGINSMQQVDLFYISPDKYKPSLYGDELDDLDSPFYSDTPSSRSKGRAKNGLKKYWKSKNFIDGCRIIFGAFGEMSADCNLFICLRGSQYKNLGSRMADKMNALIQEDPRIVYTYDDIKENPRLLKMKLKEREYRKFIDNFKLFEINAEELRKKRRR